MVFRTRGATMCAAVSLFACAGGAAASAQGYGALPSDAPVRTGDLRQHFEQATQAAAGTTGVTGPAWQITPALDLSEVFTDNAYAGSTGKSQWDAYTVLSPSVNIVGDTAKVKVNLYYAPSISIYARNSALDQVGQNLSGTAHAILVPETLFLDLRAFAGLQSLSGGVSNSSVVGQNRQNQNQTYSFSAAPYLQHRFGSFGLGEVGYTLNYSTSNNANGLNNQNAYGQPLSTQQQLLQQQQLNQGYNDNVVTQNEHVSFNSGEDFGRVNLRGYGSATQYSGSGIYSSAHNNYVTTDLGYAINRWIAAIGEVGYEDIAYSGVPPFRVKDVIWAAGAKLTPSPDTQLTATYGHRFGRPNVFVSGNYAATARLHFYARYGQSVTTNLDDIQNTLSQIDIDNAGGVYDRATGAPIAVVDDFFGLQNGVYRQDRGSVSAVLIYDRDTFSVVGSHEVRKLVSASPTSDFNLSSRGNYGTLTWSHSINPSVNTTAFVQYGRNTSTGLFSGSQDSYTASASVTYLLSEKLTLTALYTYQKSASFFVGQNTSQNYLLLGLHKQF